MTPTSGLLSETKITSVNEQVTTKENKQGKEDLQTNCCHVSCIAPNHVVLHTEL